MPRPPQSSPARPAQPSESRLSLPSASRAALPPPRPTPSQLTPRLARGAVVVLAILALAAALLTGCSGGDDDSSAPEDSIPAEPQFGYTGYDTPTGLETALVQSEPASDQLYPAPTTSTESESAPADVEAADPDSANTDPAGTAPAASELAPGPDNLLLRHLHNLDAPAAVDELHQLRYDSQQVCGSQSFTPDYSLPDEMTQAIVTPENALVTSYDVATAVWDYYHTVSRTYQQPALEKLLCLTRVTTAPKLKWRWEDLRGLVAGDASVTFLLPTDVEVLGLLTGTAMAVACLPPRAYGELSANDLAMATLMSLRWAGSRWRVSTTQDFPGKPCDELAQEMTETMESELTSTGEGWIMI